MWYKLFVASVVVVSVAGHGRVLEPPGRGSAWRSGFGTPANYDDDGLNCGGFSHQYEVNGGKCGICGDAWDAAEPRRHELGGTYGQGVIVASYSPGQVFPTTVDITAHHRGYWQFKICPDPDSKDQECFDQYPVELEEGGTEYYPNQSAIFQLNYRLPEGLTCDHCVLQWVYTAGNNWGVCANGTQGLGCGNQEEFRACTDIQIVGTTPDSFIPPMNLPAPLVHYLTRSDFHERQGLLYLLWKGLARPQQIVRLSSPHRHKNKRKKYSNKKKNKHRWKKMPTWR